MSARSPHKRSTPRAANRPAEPAIDWLLDRGGPVTRWLTLTQLIERPPASRLARARRDLLASPQVRLWLDRLDHVIAYHDSGNDRLENVAGKLAEFGLRAGMRPLDQRIRRLQKWIDSPQRNDERGMMATLNRVIVCAGLLRLGYDRPASLRRHVLARLDAVHRTAATRRYDVFLARPPADLPKAYRGRYRVVAPEFTPAGECTLPYIHDLYMLAAVPDAWRTPAVAARIDAIVEYVLAADYQRLPAGYGYLRDDTFEPPRYYVLGWNVDLPGYAGMPPQGRDRAYFVMRTELFAAFAPARRHRWLRDAMTCVGRYRTPDGRYRLPRQWLGEQSVGYWVSGSHMGIGENRRSAEAYEIESTLRVLRLQRRLAEVAASRRA